ncbi:1-acyl-sn-glycerol-3-phosphate acyltransferase [Candidatus Liberibacter asiaticus]|nr:1-acyl-sn-glycerol-3-phosphate acyltransferase [Candidatus Liberibacter asiaticus]KAE9510836.1 1-acyl-sn-glycerol-3-phosphate acyltransferase [Candidatus Liberibacter asiaticus]KAE9512209.1 1-acyl-sn-glycerol-3-phosphate acyltransferase [Candidatus Liberibacter asiaticus]KAE9513272.1 1-acyl-sn-glycerol-3-phosphate acyltransferase [Candidatus Liberibacter asiaticus]KAE9514333.1 1-acyl-sn-glycerol-3-phosphate acyltransferase [Candidatus Liberibacter asiaticus]
MIFIRSLIFNIFFFIHIFIVSMIVLLLCCFITRKQCLYIAKKWAHVNQLLLKYITKTTVQIEGVDNIPSTGCIIAIKHQSSWDTFYFLTCIQDPIFILKHTVFYIPIIGFYCFKQGMIGVKRNSKNLDMKSIINRAKKAVMDNRQLIIYPEGTRRSPGDMPIYKKGIAHIYESLSVPVIPIVVHAGLFWPRKKFMRYPGNFKVRVLKPIPAGIPRKIFFAELQEKMEHASNNLLLETIRDNPQLYIPASTKKALQHLRQIQNNS